MTDNTIGMRSGRDAVASGKNLLNLGKPLWGNAGTEETTGTESDANSSYSCVDLQIAGANNTVLIAQ